MCLSVKKAWASLQEEEHQAGWEACHSASRATLHRIRRAGTAKPVAWGRADFPYRPSTMEQEEASNSWGWGARREKARVNSEMAMLKVTHAWDSFKNTELVYLIENINYISCHPNIGPESCYCLYMPIFRYLY